VDRNDGLGIAEVNARRMLRIFAQNRMRAGEVLKYAYLSAEFQRLGGRAEAFSPGLQWLLDEGCIEIRSERWLPEMLCLTPKGYKEMQA